MTAAAKEVGKDRDTVSDWRRTTPEFQKSLVVAQYKQTLYSREQSQSPETLAITCLRQAMLDNSGNLNLRAAVVVLNRIVKTTPEQPELAAQRQPKTPAAPAQSRTTHPPAVVPDLEQAGNETPEPHKLHNHAQPNEADGLIKHPVSPAGLNLEHDDCVQIRSNSQKAFDPGPGPARSPCKLPSCSRLRLHNPTRFPRIRTAVTVKPTVRRSGIA